MAPLLAKIIPLALVSIISPIVLGYFLILLGKDNLRGRIIYFLLGSLLAILVWTIIGLLLSAGGESGEKSSFGATKNIIIGAILIFFSIKIFFSKGRRKRRKIKTHGRLIQEALAGFVLNMVNFSSAAPYILEVKEIYQANIGDFAKVITNLLVVPFFLFPIIFPLLVKKILPRAAKDIIDYTAHLMAKYGNYIIAALFFVFGILYIFKAGVF